MIVFVTGMPRAGKTIFLTYMAYFNYLQGHRIYSNYDLNFQNQKVDVWQFLSLINEDIDSFAKTTVIQEASKWFDARRAMSAENVELSNVTGQSGKRNMEIYYDDQFPERIDKGLRNLTDYTIYAEGYHKNKELLYVNYELLYGYMGQPLRQWTLTVDELRPFFSLYRTKEPTKSLATQKKDRTQKTNNFKDWKKYNGYDKKIK